MPNNDFLTTNASRLMNFHHVIVLILAIAALVGIGFFDSATFGDGNPPE